jgi:hypothetical protein
MSNPRPSQADLYDLLFEMEERVSNVVRCARAIYDLGSVNGEVSSDGLFAIGNAMLIDAKSVKDDWQRCFDLICSLNEGGR